MLFNETRIFKCGFSISLVFILFLYLLDMIRAKKKGMSEVPEAYMQGKTMTNSSVTYYINTQ